MFSRLVAGWLVVLVLAPFTAPFPTCDLATLYGHAVATAAAENGNHSHDCAMTALKQATESRTLRIIRRAQPDEMPVPPSSATVSNDALLLGSASFLGTSRSRLLLIACASPFSNPVPSSSATSRKSLQPVLGITDSAAAGTVLRV